MNLHPISIFALVLGVATALLSNAALAISFSVSQSITVSGATSGSGSGSGTATLDPATGTLTMNLTTDTVTGFTNTTTKSVATVSGAYVPNSLSGVSGNNQLIECTNNGGLVNGCGSVTSAFGTGFLSDPINFDLSYLGITTFTVRDTNTGATVEQTITLVTGGLPPAGPPATIDLTAGGPQQYIFNPGNGHTVTLTITPNAGSVTQGSSGLGNWTGATDDNALDNYFAGATSEQLNFTFSEPVILDSIALDLFEPIATNEQAQLSVNGGGFITVDENNATRTGSDLSNWKYDVASELTTFAIRTPVRGAIGNSTFRINSLVVSAPPPVDTDGDGLLDEVETDTGVYVGTSNTGTDPQDADSDDDNILDGAELAFGTNPTDSDSDDDGVDDGTEVGVGSDPLVSQFPCDVDAVAGLSLGDLLLLQRHLNRAQLLSAHEQVFCDLDLDAALTLADFQQLQRQLLGQ
ncbi:MAG TPA: hypothetical protein VIV27_04075 [Halioglobus sp.]